MTQPPDDTLLEEIEVLATNLAREAGAMLAAYFGRPLEVEYKDDKERDPVTAVDKESQEFIARGVAERFPDHGLLGEEGEEDSGPAPEFVWVVDPLDGTRNFICGLPVYACSIGVMHQGVPVAGAIFTPWPDQEDGGVVLHARRGGGAYLEGDAISVFQADEPKRNWLAALPGSFGAMYRFGKPMRGKVGEVRVAGSIAYELAMTARGVLQYSVTTGPRLWDVVAGAVLVTEAGGLVMRSQRQRGLRGLLTPTPRWEVAESLVPSWESGTTTMKDLRNWSTPLALGSPGVVRYLTSNLSSRTSLRRRITRLGWRKSGA